MDVANGLRDRVAGAGQPLSRFSAQELLNVVLFAMAYLVAYGYGSLFSQTAPAPLWFPDSVLLCALLVTPKNRWWVYITVALPLRFVPGLSEGVPKWFVLATYANDMLKGIFAAYALRRMFGGSVSLSTLREFAAYLLIAVLAAPVLSAFGGAASRGALGDEFWTAWGQWFAGDALANLILTPALLYWCTRRYGDTHSRLEIVLWIVGFSVSLYVTVALTGSHELPISMYVPIPFLIWAATRFGPIGASSALSLVTLVAMIGITARQGVFAEGDTAHAVLFLQLFLAVISVPVLFVAILIEERSAVEKRLRESQERLNENYERVRNLAGKLISAQEDERKRIALELHDDIGQRLALLAIGMADLDDNLSPRMTTERGVLRGLKRDAEEAAAVLHELSHQLHSSSLQHLGLAEGLRGLCRVIGQQHHIVVDVHAAEVTTASHDVSLCLFRVAQEALNNAVRHGKAKHISVSLRQATDVIRLEIRDDGIGFDPAMSSNGLGLTSMHERLRMVGGTLSLTSASGQGTLIEALVEMDGTTGR